MGNSYWDQADSMCRNALIFEFNKSTNFYLFICFFSTELDLFLGKNIISQTILVFMRNAGTNETLPVMGWKLNWQILKNVLIST